MKFYIGMCHGITCLKIKKKYSESCLVFSLNAFFLKTNSVPRRVKTSIAKKTNQ